MRRPPFLPIVMACPGTDVWWFDDDGVLSMPAEQTGRWQVLRGFPDEGSEP